MTQRGKNSIDEKEILAALKSKSELISIDFYQTVLIFAHYDTEK